MNLQTIFVNGNKGKVYILMECRINKMIKAMKNENNNQMTFKRSLSYQLL